MVVPVSNQDELPCCGFQECQDPCKDLSVGGALDGFIGLEVDSDDQNGSCLGLPKKSLVATALNLKGFKLGEPMGCVMDDNDSAMVAVVGGIAVGWVSKSMSAPNLKVLTHGVVLLSIEMCFNQDVDLVVSSPVPVQGAFAKSCDVCHMEAHVVLGVACLLGWRAVERWIVIRSLRRWQGSGYLPWCDQRRGLYAPDLYNLARYLRRQKGQHLGSGSIIGNPHEVFVDEDGIVMSGLMGGSSMADVRQRDVLLAGSGETVHGAWDGVRAMRV